jgi:hypothetical protein
VAALARDDVLRAKRIGAAKRREAEDTIGDIVRKHVSILEFLSFGK